MTLKDGLFLGVTLKIAAEYLGTTPDNLRGAIKRGSLKGYKQGRDWFVGVAEVERYARENRRGTTQYPPNIER